MPTATNASFPTQTKGIFWGANARTALGTAAVAAAALTAAGIAGAVFVTEDGRRQRPLLLQLHADVVQIKKADRPGLPSTEQIEKVSLAIAELIRDNMNLGPTMIRLAWHGSGSYSKADRNGGSQGGHIRLPPERNFGANKGLDVAMDELEAIKKQFPFMSYADLYTLAGVVAVKELGGPLVVWRPGRSDLPASSAAPDGRLPSADVGTPQKQVDHTRQVFYRMGFTDQEIVALIGAHAVGFCHPDNSGYSGPWTHDPYRFTNSFYKELLRNRWEMVQLDNGQRQFMTNDRSIMMLPGDMAFLHDATFRRYVELYATDEALWRRDFAAAFAKLLELGCEGLLFPTLD